MRKLQVNPKACSTSCWEASSVYCSSSVLRSRRSMWNSHNRWVIEVTSSVCGAGCTSKTAASAPPRVARISSSADDEIVRPRWWAMQVTPPAAESKNSRLVVSPQTTHWSNAGATPSWARSFSMNAGTMSAGSLFSNVLSAPHSIRYSSWSGCLSCAIWSTASATVSALPKRSEDPARRTYPKRNWQKDCW